MGLFPAVNHVYSCFVLYSYVAVLGSRVFFCIHNISYCVYKAIIYNISLFFLHKICIFNGYNDSSWLNSTIILLFLYLYVSHINSKTSDEYPLLILNLKASKVNFSCIQYAIVNTKMAFNCSYQIPPQWDTLNIICI